MNCDEKVEGLQTPEPSLNGEDSASATELLGFHNVRAGGALLNRAFATGRFCCTSLGCCHSPTSGLFHSEAPVVAERIRRARQPICQNSQRVDTRLLCHVLKSCETVSYQCEFQVGSELNVHLSFKKSRRWVSHVRLYKWALWASF